jgi:phage shock protein E
MSIMKKYALAIVLSTSVFFACSGEESHDVEGAEQSIKTIQKDLPAKEFKENASKGLLLDVRTPEEFAEGNISGAVNLDIYNANFSAELDKLDKTKPVYVYCRSGSRSSKASNMMKEKGFKEVYNLIGGYSNYPFK